MDTYLEDSARTVGTDFHDDLVPYAVLFDALIGRLTTSGRVDQVKKTLFYGRPDDEIAFAAKIMGPSDYGNTPHDLIHAVLGNDTESAELVEILRDVLITKSGITEDVKKKLINEAGDQLWYLALLFRLLGVTFEEVASANIEKLKIRYPDKFTPELAMNRDESKEDVAFQ